MAKFFDHRFVESMLALENRSVHSVISDKSKSTSGRNADARLACTQYVGRPVSNGFLLLVAVAVQR